MNTNDFNLWRGGVPVVSVAGSPEFNLWRDGAPLADVGALLGGTPPEGGVKFRDLPVFHFVPHYDGVASGQMDDLQIEAGGYGVATPWRTSGAIRRTVRIPIVLQGLSTIGELRRFWDSHNGRLKPFWLPSWVNDYGVMQDETAGSTSITVAGHTFSQKYPLGDQFRFIALLTAAGKLECYGVTAVDDSGDDDVLTLSAGLDTALVASQTVCCPLLMVRPSGDDLDFDYLSGDVIKGAIDCVECPQEYPGTADASSAADSVHLGTRPLFLYRITDGTTTLRLADYGVDVSAASLTWLAADITGDEITSSMDMLGDSLRVTIKTDDPSHPLLGYLDPLQCRNFTVEMWLTDVDSLTTLDLLDPDHVGRIEEVAFGSDGKISLEVSSLFRFGEQRFPKFKLQRLGNESVYRYASEAAFTTAGTISAISSDPPYIEATAFGDTATAEGDPNWFALGKVTVGDEFRTCTGQSGNRLYLNYPLRRAVVGSSASAVAGDDKRASTWNTKFNQLDNFMGFPYIPAKNPQFKALETPKQGGGKKG